MAIVSGETTATGRSPSQLLVGLEPKLRRALVARYGVELGCEVAAEAVAWGVEHADRLAAMENPAGYLYRVGQTAARKLAGRRPVVGFPREPAWPDVPDLPGDVFEELRQLREPQRVAVLLVHGYAFTYREVADLLDISEAAVNNHVHRGLRTLRARLGGTT